MPRAPRSSRSASKVRYVLAGAAKRLSGTIPAGACARLATLEITARAEQFTLSRKLDVNRTHCE